MGIEQRLFSFFHFSLVTEMLLHLEQLIYKLLLLLNYVSYLFQDFLFEYIIAYVILMESPGAVSRDTSVHSLRVTTLSVKPEADVPDEEPKEFPLTEVKERAISQIRMVSKHDRDHQGFIKCTKAFIDFTQTETCDNLIVAVVYYVSSSLFLTLYPELDPVAEQQQTVIRSQSKQIISSLYCQILLSPMSAAFRVREERIFYETLFFFLNVCACYSVRYEPTDVIHDLVAGVFRKGIPDPNSRRQSEFLPITEIVRRNWLSQRVPGKNRSEIPHSTLRGNTELIGSVVQKEVATGERAAATGEQWNERGFPVDSAVPYGDKILNREILFALPQPRDSDAAMSPLMGSVVATEDVTPR
jgi:hypothetical protein